MINTVERVDANNRVEAVLDAAGDDWDYAAAGAGVELCGLRAKDVLGHERRILDHYLQSGARIGGPYATVLDAKRAGTGAGGYLDRVGLPGKGERDVPAVTATVNQHARVLCLRRLTIY
jgi:hypothetical protein